MKKNLLISTMLFVAVSLLAQAPQAFKYQTVVRNNSGNLIPNQPVSFRIGILQDSINGLLIYSEIHSVTTNQFGLAAIEIGIGTVESGVFKDISWGMSSHFLKVELDETGNTNYQLMGISQLLSVPYSLNSGSLTLTDEDGKNWKVTVDTSGNLLITCFPPTTIADAGYYPTKFCFSTVLEGNEPEVGTGLWTIEYGNGGNIDEPENPNSLFSGTAGGQYLLRWSISSPCGVSFNEAWIVFYDATSIANAGDDQVGVSSPTILEADMPVFGDGEWTIISGEGGFIDEPLNPTSLFSGLVNTTYTLRWTITSPCDTTFDEVNITFENCPATVTDIDGNTYNTVLIGTQCWIKENLKTTTYSNGIPIPNVTENIVWGSLTTGAYAWINNDISWKDEYGAFYNWYAVSDPNGLCPDGWHVPDYDEWIAFMNYIGGANSPHGNMLKSCRQVNSPFGGECTTNEHPRWDQSETENGTDDYGFAGLPGGMRSIFGYTNFLGTIGFFWFSTAYSSDYALRSYLHNDIGNVSISEELKQSGFSVRCIKD